MPGDVDVRRGAAGELLEALGAEAEADDLDDERAEEAEEAQGERVRVLAPGVRDAAAGRARVALAESVGRRLEEVDEARREDDARAEEPAGRARASARSESEVKREGGEREPGALGKVKDAAGNNAPQDADALRHDGEHGPDEARDLRGECGEKVRPCSRTSETVREIETHEDDEDGCDAQRHLADRLGAAGIFDVGHGARRVEEEEGWRREGPVRGGSTGGSRARRRRCSCGWADD